MPATCHFCGSEMELSHDGTTRSVGGGEFQVVPPRRHWLQCRLLDCRARGPAKRTPEAASLALLESRAGFRILPAA